jgi:hypothetical protein
MSEMEEENEEEEEGANEMNIDALVNVANGVSVSQAKAIKTAMKHLDTYFGILNKEDSTVNRYEKYSPELIPFTFFTKDFVGKFADYMMTVKKIKKYLTLNGYMSKIKMKLTNDYDPQILPFLATGLFWTKLCFAITKFYVTKSAHTGEALVDKAPPMTFQDLQIIANILIEKNTPDSNESRCLAVHQYQVSEVCRCIDSYCCGELRVTIVIDIIIFFLF